MEQRDRLPWQSHPGIRRPVGGCGMGFLSHRNPAASRRQIHGSRFFRARVAIPGKISPIECPRPRDTAMKALIPTLFSLLMVGLPARAAEPQTVSYVKDVKPILAKYCLSCHS